MGTNFVSILIFQFVISIHLYVCPEECKLMRFEFGKQTGKTLNDVYSYDYIYFCVINIITNSNCQNCFSNCFLQWFQ